MESQPRPRENLTFFQISDFMNFLIPAMVLSIERKDPTFLESESNFSEKNLFKLMLKKPIFLWIFLSFHFIIIFALK